MPKKSVGEIRRARYTPTKAHESLEKMLVSDNEHMRRAAADSSEILMNYNKASGVHSAKGPNKSKPTPPRPDGGETVLPMGQDEKKKPKVKTQALDGGETVLPMNTPRPKPKPARTGTSRRHPDGTFMARAD